MSTSDRDEPGTARSLPPRLDPRAGAATGRRGGSGTRLAWALRGLAALLSVALLGTGGWGWYLGRVAEASVSRTDAIPDSGNKETVHTGAAMNLLLVGNDSRANLTKQQLEELNAGKDSGINTDTMILVHVPADGSAASFVSFPRDSYVTIPGHGKDKLNAAYAYGMQSAASGASQEQQQAAGAQLLVQTISQLSGLQIDHYAEVDLLGFFDLTSVVGGVEVNLCQAVDDRRWSGAYFPAGVQTISGADALKFVRQRHNIGKTSNDFDRIRRQQVFIAGVVRKMLSEKVLLNPAKQRELVQAVAGSVTIDKDLELMELARQMQGVKPGAIEFQTVPNVGEAKLPSGTSIVKLADADTLHTFFAQLSADPAPAPGAATPSAPAAPETVAPAQVSVQVLNGLGVKGLAAKAATQLTTAGFEVAGTANADSSTYATTEVRFAAGDDALAATLAAAVPGATTKQVATATAGTVQLVLGKDFNGVGRQTTAQPPSSAAATPTEEARTAEDTSCIN
ncbi:LCP family protein [Modestobacter sp. NPDC049651]|uniref:LCP family protein n=1 Tax=unclassified Modestobacter TaxID=2643866 RepID=UPI0033C7A026